MAIKAKSGHINKSEKNKIFEGSSLTSEYSERVVFGVASLSYPI